MKLPDAILAKLLARFDSLTAEGRNLLDAANATDLDKRQPEVEKFVEWRTKAATLLDTVVPHGNIHRDAVGKIPNLTISCDALQETVGLLRGVRDDLNRGFLDDLATTIEAEVTADYLGQAEQLLTEGRCGKFEHVPAAVLAGAILEKALHTLCRQQQPAIELRGARGAIKTLGPLIDDLKKAGAFNEAKAKQLHAWANIRNLAAHGEFKQFKSTDVKALLSGIKQFLADHLK